MKKILTIILVGLFLVSTVNLALAEDATDLSKEISNLNNLTSEERSELQEELLELISEDVLTFEEAVNEVKDDSVKNMNSSEDITTKVLSNAKGVDQEKIESTMDNSEAKEEVREILKEAFEKGMTAEEINKIIEEKPQNPEQFKSEVEKSIERKEERGIGQDIADSKKSEKAKEAKEKAKENRKNKDIDEEDDEDMDEEDDEDMDEEDDEVIFTKSTKGLIEGALKRGLKQIKKYAAY